MNEDLTVLCSAAWRPKKTLEFQTLAVEQYSRIAASKQAPNPHTRPIQLKILHVSPGLGLLHATAPQQFAAVQAQHYVCRENSIYLPSKRVFFAVWQLTDWQQ
jgi:hypothetical protein